MTDPTGVRLPDEAIERQLLRDVIAWARANGYSYDGGGYEKNWDSGRVQVGIEAYDHDQGATMRVYCQGEETITGPRFVYQAVDILVALGVLPVEFSTAYAAGRREVLDGARVEYAARWHGQIMGHFSILGDAAEEAVREALDYADITDAEVVTRQVVETEWRAVQAGETPP